MEDSLSPSTRLLEEDSQLTASMAACDQLHTTASQTRLDGWSSETVSHDMELESEEKPILLDSDSDTDAPAVKIPRLDEVTSIHGIKVDSELAKVKVKISDSAKNAGVESSSIGESGASSTQKLEPESLRGNAGTGDRNDRSGRRRNKSTSAAVLLGLVKSRVKKLTDERQRETTKMTPASKTSSSETSAAVSASGSDTTLSSTSSPRLYTPPGKCVCDRVYQ